MGWLRRVFRSPATKRAFDEQGYLRTYPDVAAAVAAGQIASGYDHFNRWGQSEGRVISRVNKISVKALPAHIIKVDQLSFFSGLLIASGTVSSCEKRIVGVQIGLGDQKFDALLGHAGPGTFFFHGKVPFGDSSLPEPILILRYQGGEEDHIADAVDAELEAEAGHQLFFKFQKLLRDRPAGEILEIGSRAKSGNERRSLMPKDWGYVGLDIMPGENVDVVGDAHSMSRNFEQNRFNAVMSVSVFEHLAMPWKVVIEMNKVMAVGAIGYIQTHQSFPLHEMPWDFWRFSESSWATLFNKATGYRIIETASGEPLMMVAQRWHPIVDYGNAIGSALSCVLVEKTAETHLTWDVDPSGLAIGDYPH